MFNHFQLSPCFPECVAKLPVSLWGHAMTLHTPHFTHYSPHFTLYTPHFTLYTPHLTLDSWQSALYTPQSTPYTAHSTLYTPHLTPYTANLTPRTLHSTLYTQQYGKRGKIYKTVQIVCFTKVFYVTAFRFVGCILFFHHFIYKPS